jgi:hypothetical protein
MFEIEILEPGKLPEDLADGAPGVDLARLLEPVDRDSLSGFDRVILLQAHQKLVSHFQAELYADMVSVVGATAEELGSESDLEGTLDLAASEIRAGLSWTRRAAEYQVSFAVDLVERLPQVWVALDSGWIDLPRARVIINQTLHLEEETAREVAEAVLEGAGHQTTGQLRARIQKLCISVDPESAKRRYEQGVEGRQVTSEANDDGTTNLYGLDLPVDQANAAMRRINRLARAAKSVHDKRSMDQIRADVFLDLLNGRHKHSREAGRGIVDIQVDLTTLAGLDENPGELNGYGPVIADIARQVTETQPGAEWRVTVTDPETGLAIHNGTTRRRPDASLKRHVETRNPTCVFPGCRMPATDCDLDHNQEWAKGGATEPGNLAPFCRHDHVIKHKGWKTRQIRPGVYELTSPLGHTYTTGPDPP